MCLPVSGSIGMPLYLSTMSGPADISRDKPLGDMSRALTINCKSDDNSIGGSGKPEFGIRGDASRRA